MSFEHYADSSMRRGLGNAIPYISSKRQFTIELLCSKSNDFEKHINGSYVEYYINGLLSYICSTAMLGT